MNNKTVMEKFLQTSQDHTEMTEGQKKKVHFEILNKVRNVTSSDVLDVFREENTARGRKNKETHLILCQGLDSM